MDQKTKNGFRYLWQLIINAGRTQYAFTGYLITLGLIIIPVFLLLDWISRSNLPNNAKLVLTIVLLVIFLAFVVLWLIKSNRNSIKIKDQNKQELTELQKVLYPNVVFKNYDKVIFITISLLILILTIITLSK